MCGTIQEAASGNICSLSLVIDRSETNGVPAVVDKELYSQKQLCLSPFGSKIVDIEAMFNIGVSNYRIEN